MTQGEVSAGRLEAENLVRWPAAILLVVAACDVLFFLAYVLGSGIWDVFGRLVDHGASGLDPWLASSLPGFFVAGLCLATGVVGVVGAWRMLQLRSWPLAVAASVLALVPCLGLCCGCAFPVGVWGLLVLLRPEVREAFSEPGSTT